MIKVKITHNNTEYGSKEFEAVDIPTAKIIMIKLIENSHWIQGEWTKEVSNLQKTVNGEVVYFHPSNFTYEVRNRDTNPTQEEIDEDARMQEIQEIKSLAVTISESNLPVWHKKLLRRLILEMKE